MLVHMCKERRGEGRPDRCGLLRLCAGGRAVGVRLEGRGSRGQGEGAVIRARRGVVSNASVWDTQALLPAEGGGDPGWRREALGTPRTGSFMHLHLGGGSSSASMLMSCAVPDTSMFASDSSGTVAMAAQHMFCPMLPIRPLSTGVKHLWCGCPNPPLTIRPRHKERVQRRPVRGDSDA